MLSEVSQPVWLHDFVDRDMWEELLYVRMDSKDFFKPHQIPGTVINPLIEADLFEIRDRSFHERWWKAYRLGCHPRKAGFLFNFLCLSKGDLKACGLSELSFLPCWFPTDNLENVAAVKCNMEISKKYSP